jgi:surface polysaccharide O-acyltransferase-like enzyme
VSVYALFRAGVDHGGWRWGYLDLLGRHALAGYVIHGLVSDAVRPFVPKDAPGWYVTLAVLVYLGIVTLFVRYLERNRLFFRL